MYCPGITVLIQSSQTTNKTTKDLWLDKHLSYLFGQEKWENQCRVLEVK